MHSKFVLVEPDTTYLGSMNLVHNTMFDGVMGIRSRDVHDYYANWFEEIKSKSQSLCGNSFFKTEN
jgi:hypothetical protein